MKNAEKNPRTKQPTNKKTSKTNEDKSMCTSKPLAETQFLHLGRTRQLQVRGERGIVLSFLRLV